MSKRKSSGASQSKSKGGKSSAAPPVQTASSAPSQTPASSGTPSAPLITTASRTRERQIERRQQQRRQQQLAIAASFAVFAIIAVVLVVVINQPAEAPIPTGAEDRYADIALSTTERGYPRLGQAQGTVRVVEYSSFGCPSCRNFHEDIFPTMLERVRRGEISFTFVPLDTGSVSNALGAARSALCAAEQDKFWPYHDALFNWQGAYGNQAFSGQRLVTGIRNLRLDVDIYNTCLGSQQISQTLEAAKAEAEEVLDVIETPSITIDGVEYPAALDTINAAIDQRLLAQGIIPGAGVQPPVPTQPEATVEPEAEPRATRTPS